MTVEVIEPTHGTVVETTVDAAPVLEIHAQDAAVVEVVEAGPGAVVEVLTMAPALVEVVAPAAQAFVVEVVQQAPTVVEVVAPIPGIGSDGVVSWLDITDKPTSFPPAEHTTEIITDFSTAVQQLISQYGGGEGSGDPASLYAHIHDPTPHPAYDAMPSLKLFYENGLI